MRDGDPVALKSIRLDRLQAQLRGDALAPAYLLAGQEPLLLLEAADTVRAAARRLGFAEREVLEAGESGFDWGALAASSRQGSLFGGNRRLIDLRLPGGKAGKDGSEALQAWARAPADPDTVLLVTCTQWGREWEKPAWVPALANLGVYVPIWPLKRADLPRWIAERARQRSLLLDEQAIDLLAGRTEGNLLACAQEIDKLVLLGETGHVDGRRLDALLAEQSRLDVFALTDAAFAAEPLRALRIARSLRAEGESPVPMLGWIGNQVELLLRMAETEAAGRSVEGLFREERVWDARQAPLKSTLSRLGLSGCRRAAARLARLDRLAKGQERGDVWTGIDRLLVQLARATRPRRLPA